MATRRIGSLPAACVVGVLLVGDPHLGSSGIGHGAALAADGATLRDGTLTVEGTSGPDLIVLQASSHPRAVRVVLNGKQLGRFEPVHGVVVRAGEGNDIVRLDPQLGLPAKLDGGPGDDRLRGGPGPELFYGRDGNDVMIGGGGRDGFHGGPGRNRLVLPPSMGTLRVGPSAGGETLQLLARAYTLRPLSSAKAALGPVIVGATDLRDPDVAELVRRAYNAGETVGVTGVKLADASLLPSAACSVASPAWTSDHPTMDLVNLRRATRPDGRTHFLTELVAPSKPGSDAAAAGQGRARRHGEMHRLELLSRTYSQTPVVPDLPVGDDDPADLLQIADSCESKALGTDNNLGNTVQVVTNVWGARSFENKFDAYYFQQEFDISLGTFSGVRSWSNVIGTFPQFQGGITVVQPGPQSSMATTTVTSGVSQSYGGNVGFNQSQLANVTASAGVTISRTESTTVPPITVQNAVDTETGVTSWTYFVNDLPSFAETIDVYQQWIWQVPFNLYPSNATSFQYATGGSMLVDYEDDSDYELDTPQINPSIPLPFGTSFAIDKPVITGLSSSTVATGDQFTIDGTGFYPSLVTAVLIDGTPLQPTQYVVNSPQSVTATAPFSGAFMPVQVQTTEGFSNDNFTISACPIVCAGPAPAASRR